MVVENSRAGAGSGLYLHIPFCLGKCPYCDFYSVPVREAELAAYPELLLQHLRWAADQGWSGALSTVYFGGGTPSLLPPQAIGELLAAAERRFGLTVDAEITLEANPGTLSAERLAGYRAAGVNRLSLGLQSLDPAQLSNLGRRHSRTEGLQAVRRARQAGFANLSLDLMFALPGQTLAALQDELRAYLELDPEHLSCYGLTAEPDTPFGRQVAAGQMVLPDDGLYAEAYELLHAELSAAGFDHYEIANYARPGRACRHNQAYWERRPYLGLGAGAHSFRAANWGTRWAVAADLAAYRQALAGRREPADRLEEFDRRGAMSETLYLGLRTRRGVSDDEFHQRFGCGVAAAFPEAVAELGDRLQHEAGSWSFSPASWLFYDRLIQAFL